MNDPLQSELEDFRESLRRFVKHELLPANGRDAGLNSGELMSAMGSHGFLGFDAPERLGGAGVQDARFGAIVLEELVGVGLVGPALCFLGHSELCIPALVNAATSELEAWARRLVAGTSVAALIEDGIRVERDASNWKVTGVATAVTNATAADVFLVVAGLAEQSPGLMLLNPNAAGVQVGPRLELVGLPGHDLADVALEDVPVDEFLQWDTGPTGPTHSRLRSRRDIGFAVLALAGARRAHDLTMQYVKQRRVFGQLLASFENTRFVLAQQAVEIEIGQSFVDICLTEVSANALAPRAAAMAKLWCTDTALRATDGGVQLHGGYGYMLEYPISRIYADMQILSLLSRGDSAHEFIAADIGL